MALDRRQFLQTVGAAASSPAVSAQTVNSGNTERRSALRAWLFWDQWHIEHQDNLELCQGKAEWHPEATYEDPNFDNPFAWPVVFQDADSGQWRMLYGTSLNPATLMGAESSDGIHWQPMNRPEVQPAGKKYSPNHLFTMEHAEFGPVYVDPVAAGGYRFKLFGNQSGAIPSERALRDEKHYWHKVVKAEGAKPYVADQFIAVSKDGIRWAIDEDTRFGSPPRQLDTPITCFHNSRSRQYTMLLRSGWGERRVAMQHSPDFQRWSEPSLLLEPDPLDPPQAQFYGMPVIPYEDYYVGLLWVFHSSSSERLRRYNEFWGSIDTQLTYSLDGLHFQRGLRTPFIGLNEPGLPGSGIIYPSSVVAVHDELRIYSSSSKHLHMQYGQGFFQPKGKIPACAMLMHTLRKDGFMYLTSRGNWAEFTSKPIVLHAADLTMNVQAPVGEVRVQLSDMNGTPFPGFAFDDCSPFKEADSTSWTITWQGKTASALIGKPMRLEARFRNARIYALRGDFQWLDNSALLRANDGKIIPRLHFDI